MLWSYYRLGQIFEARKQYRKAEQNYQNSIDKIEEVREDMKIEEFKTAFFASKMAPYEALIHLRFKLGKCDTAFNLAQRSKARAFLDLLANKKNDAKIAMVPGKLFP